MTIRPARFTVLRILLALAVSLQAGQLPAQSTDPEAKRQEVAQAKKIVQEIRDGHTPSKKELDFLDGVLSHLASSLTVGQPAKGAVKQTPPSPETKPIEPKPTAVLAAGYSETKTTAGIVYSYLVDPKSATLRGFWRDQRKVPYGSIDALRDELEGQGIELKFAINGGIFERDHRPKGLYIEQGTVISSLDQSHPGDQAGNFYLEPNGVFLVDAKGVPRIVTTDRFVQEFPKSTMGTLRLALQSGPVLLVEREINFKFAESSQNRVRRSGVGVFPDGRVIFAISSNEISFREFATFFKDIGCSDALYLDGGPVPSFYVDKRAFLGAGSDLVTIFGVINTAADRNQLGDPR